MFFYSKETYIISNTWNGTELSSNVSISITIQHIMFEEKVRLQVDSPWFDEHSKWSDGR